MSRLLKLASAEAAGIPQGPEVQPLPGAAADRLRESYPRDLANARLGTINDPASSAHLHVRNMDSGGFYASWHISMAEGPNVYCLDEISEAEGMAHIDERRRWRESMTRFLDDDLSDAEGV